MVECYNEWENIVCMSVTYISVKYIPLCEVGNFLKFIVDVDRLQLLGWKESAWSRAQMSVGLTYNVLSSL